MRDSLKPGNDEFNRRMKALANLERIAGPVKLPTDKKAKGGSVEGQAQGGSVKMSQEVGRPHGIKSLSFEDYAPNEVELVNLEAHEQGKGHGTRAMRKITEAADKHKINLMLIPAGDESKRERLSDFYGQHGFNEDGDVLRRPYRRADGGAVKLPTDKKNKGGKVEVRPTVFDDAASRRNPSIEAAARALMEGELKQKAYAKLVAKEKPVKKYDFIPQPATNERAMDILLPRQKQNWRAHESWPAGRRVGLRLDIPAYERHGVWVNSVHDEEGSGEHKLPNSYGPVSSVRNATFEGSPDKAIRVATGEQNKNSFARIKGELEHINEEQAVEHFKKYLNHPDYRQVGYDPRRHGDFYDRETMQPITHSEHVVQIGPLVLAKNPKYGKPSLYAKGGDVDKAKFLEGSKVKDVLYRGGIGHKELPTEFLEGKPRVGYATFASTSPHVAGSYAHTDEGESEFAGGIAPMHINVHTLHEFPVTVDKHGSRRFDKFAFDRHARQLQPGHALVARQVIDYGSRASTKTDPQKLYSYPSDIYAWNKGTKTKSAISKAKGGITHAHHLEIEERPL